MTEFGLIQRFFAPTADALPVGWLGVGDDCALVSPTPGQQLAISTDTLVEGRHFLPNVAPDALGHKALAVNLSDLAACGAKPLAFTLALTLPSASPFLDEAWLQGFANGLLALAREHGIALVGGDTTGAPPVAGHPAPLMINITVFGEVPPGQALLRSGARVGDEIWVSHPLAGDGLGLGDARLALECFRGHVALSAEDFATVRERMERPTPRVALGLALRGIASAAVDVSDGLLGDLGHVLTASGVGAELDADALVAGAASGVLKAQALALQRLCTLAGGDDYELCFTAPPARAGAVRAAAQAAGCGVTRFGRVVAGSGPVVCDATGQTLSQAEWASFDHFASG
jgi:thiamine-monophosphate kinase